MVPVEWRFWRRKAILLFRCLIIIVCLARPAPGRSGANEGGQFGRGIFAEADPFGTFFRSENTDVKWGSHHFVPCGDWRGSETKGHEDLGWLGKILGETPQADAGPEAVLGRKEGDGMNGHGPTFDWKVGFDWQIIAPLNKPSPKEANMTWKLKGTPQRGDSFDPSLILGPMFVVLCRV